MCNLWRSSPQSLHRLVERKMLHVCHKASNRLSSKACLVVHPYTHACIVYIHVQAAWKTVHIAISCHRIVTHVYTWHILYTYLLLQEYDRQTETIHWRYSTHTDLCCLGVSLCTRHTSTMYIHSASIHTIHTLHIWDCKDTRYIQQSFTGILQQAQVFVVCMHNRWSAPPHNSELI